MKKILLALCLLLPTTALADRSVTSFPVITPASDDYWILTDTSNSGLLSKVATSNVRAALGLATTDSPSFVDITSTSDINVKDWIYFTSDDDTHTVSLAAGNNTANYILRWPVALGTGGLFTSSAAGQMSFTDPASFLTPSGVGGALSVTATGFDGNLTTADNTVQEIAQKFDDFVASGGGYTNLTSFIAQTPNAVFYSDANGDVKEVVLGANGTYFRSNGAGAAPTFDTPSGAAHDAVTLDTELATILSLSTQQITLDSQTANYFLAAPNGSAGDPTFRAMVDADIPAAIARDSEIPAAVTDATISTSAVATNDASTTKHGWLMMATAPAAGLRNILAIDNAETSYKNAALFDATTPAAETSGASGSAGTAMTAARRDHVHALPTIPTISDTAYGAGWNGDTGAGSKNAIYDVMETKANSTGITFLASALSDMKILDAAQPVTGQQLVLDTMSYANADDALHVWSIDKVGSELAGKQASDSDLTTWAGVTPGTGVATFIATPLSANLATAITDETGSGALVFGTSPVFTTSAALPQGASPTVDAAGEVAVDTTSDQFIFYGAAKRVLTYKKQIDFAVKTPVDLDDFLLFKAQTAMTITDIHVIAQGGTSISVDIQECTSAGATCVTVDAAITADTDGAEDDGTLSNGAIDAGDWVKVVLGAPSGTVNYLAGSIYYVETDN